MAHHVSDMDSGDFWTFWKQKVTAETPSSKKWRPLKRIFQPLFEQDEGTLRQMCEIPRKLI